MNLADFKRFLHAEKSEVGYSHGLTISYDDWQGFVEFVKAIDDELNTLPKHQELI